MTWQLLAIGVPLLFVVYQSLSKFLPKDLSPFLVNAYASAIGMFVMLALYFLTAQNKSLSLSPKYLPFVIAIGVLIALANAGIIRAYGLGAPQSGFTSIFYPLLIVYALIVGIVFWHEKLGLYQGIGLALSLAGMFLITYFK